MKIFFAIFLSFALASGCATTYVPPDFEQYRTRHSTIAVLPFGVTITGKNQREGVTSEELAEEALSMSSVFQQKVYSEFLQKNYTIKFQDIDETNLLLKRNNAVDEEGKLTLTKIEASNLLGVDAVLSGNIVMMKPMGTGAAIASAIFLGISNTNEITANLAVHDGATGDLVWSYSHEEAGGLGVSPQIVAENLMESVAFRFPYKL